MAFDFPNAPTIGESFTPPGGPTYVWDGVTWAQSDVATSIAGVFKLGSGTLGANAAFLDIPLLHTGCVALELHLANVDVTTAGSISFDYSMDGTTFPAAASTYQGTFRYNSTAGGALVSGGQVQTNNWIFWTIAPVASIKAAARLWMPTPATGIYPMTHYWSSHYDGTAYRWFSGFSQAGTPLGAAGPPVAGRLRPSLGNLVAGLKWQLNGIK